MLSDEICLSRVRLLTVHTEQSHATFQVLCDNEGRLFSRRQRNKFQALDTFLDKYFEQNPIAQIGVIVCKEKKAERIINLTGNIRQVKEQLATITEASCSGDFSLQNGLQLALVNLK